MKTRKLSAIRTVVTHGVRRTVLFSWEMGMTSMATVPKAKVRKRRASRRRSDPGQRR
jgi:hypothetical protein